MVSVLGPPSAWWPHLVPFSLSTSVYFFVKWVHIRWLRGPGSFPHLLLPKCLGQQDGVASLGKGRPAGEVQTPSLGYEMCREALEAWLPRLEEAQGNRTERVGCPMCLTSRTFVQQG